MLRINRAKQMYFDDETKEMLEKNWAQCSCIDESEYLELLIRKEYQAEHPEEIYQKKEEAAQNILSAAAALQRLLSLEILLHEEEINKMIKGLKSNTKKLQKHFKG